MSGEVVVLIPARSGSKAVPDKNIRPLGGKPLLAYSIAAARLSERINRVVVSTDSQVYADMARRYGAEVPFLRPKEISGDGSLDIEFVAHYLDFVRNNGMAVPELLVHLRPTTPLRDVNVIDSAIEYMLGHSEASALRSMHETSLTPYKMFRLQGEYASAFLSYQGQREFYNLPRQVFEPAYIPNGYVDILRPTVLLETGLLHGEKMKLWLTPPTPDIDVADDYNEASMRVYETEFSRLLEYLREIDGPLS